MGRQHLGVPKCELEPTNQSGRSIVSRARTSSNGRGGAKYDNGSLDRTYVSRIGAAVVVCISVCSQLQFILYIWLRLVSVESLYCCCGLVSTVVW